MLRLWRERIVVSLAPTGVAWLRLSGGSRGDVREKLHTRGEAPQGELPWSAAATIFQKQSTAWLASSVDVSVVLSNEFVRYALIPPTPGVAGDDETLALARFHFGKIHGARAQAWEIRLSPAARDSARMAAAIDSALIKQLRDCFPGDARARLLSVQPWLMSAYNSVRSQVPTAGAWLLLLEPGRACSALLDGNLWKSVQNIRAELQDDGAVLSLLERERLRLDGAAVPRAVLVQDARDGATAPTTKTEWKLEALKVRWPAGVMESRDRAYQMALTAL